MAHGRRRQALPPDGLARRVHSWQERFDECRDKLSPFLKGCGYNLKRDVVFIPISAYTAQNVIKPYARATPLPSAHTRVRVLIAAPRRSLRHRRRVGDAAPWWDGPTFLSTLDALPVRLDCALITP